MMKKLLHIVVAIYAVTHITGCSSGSPKEESEVAATEDEAFAEEGEKDFADTDKPDAAAEKADEVADAGDKSGNDDLALDDQKADGKTDQVAGDDELAAETGDKADAGKQTDVAANTQPDEDASEFPEEAPAETQTAQAEQPSDENLFTADNKDAAPTDEAPSTTAPVEDQSVAQAPVVDQTPSTADTSYAAAAPVYHPLQKVKDAPFTKNGVLMNRVYLARAGDTYKSVSEKVYGSADKAGQLKKWNGASKNSLKVGEKVYYNSPRDPQDSARMLTYYEDAGVQPQIHTTADGDNIRELGKTLLGDPNGWKELWATNSDIESKGALPAGLQLKYWPDSAAVPAQTMAQAPTEPPAAQPPTQPATPDVAANTAPPGQDPMQVPPTGDMNPAQQPAAQPGQQVAQTDPMAQSTPEMAPPPVAGTNEAPPPPPPVDQQPVQKKAPATAEAPQDDMTTTMGIAGLGLVGLAVPFIMMKKNRARRIDLSQTQV